VTASLPRIRPAQPADWEQIWPFLRGVLAAGETYTYPQDISEAQARAAWLLEEPWLVLVAELPRDAAHPRPGPVAGLVKVGPNLPGRGAHVANASFVVDPAASGRGVGRALAEAALVQARQRGFRAMQFNAVVETNTRAVALWQSLGFRILATVPAAFDHPVHGHVGLHVMHRRP
jgi:ribosomal protein S18 acetylase RimI-like enzyme